MLRWRTVPAPGTTSRILVVEDDPDISESLASLLRDEGYDVEVAADGVLAVEAACKSPPDLVLLDLMLPRLDGVGVAAELDKMGLGLSRVPIVLVSAGHQLAEAARKIGTTFVLRKPFELREILLSIERALDGRGAKSL
jgi:DNA-binding response OmpR family regulator